MDNPSPDASLQPTENIVGGESVCAVVDDAMPYSLIDMSSTVSAVPPEKISDSNGALVTTDDGDQRWSVQITSDQVVEDDDESMSHVESSDPSDMYRDIRHILIMDVVQEMDEVERYSYISFVAYAMHQLFEYSAWNEYVMFYLLTIHL